MKKCNFYILTVLLAMCFVGCQNKEYKNIVPKNANVVFAVDLKTLLNDVKIPESAKSKFESLSSLISQETGLQQLSKLFEGENTTGIDWLSPFYIFRSPDVEFGLTLKVSNEDELDALMESLSKQNVVDKTEEKDGLKLTTIMGEVNLAYDSNSLVLMMPKNTAQTKKTLVKLFEQSEDDSFTATDVFEKLDDKNEPFLFYANGTALEDLGLLGLNLPALFSALPEGVRLVDTNLITSASFKNGRTDISYELFSPKKKTQKLLEDVDKKFKKIKGDFIYAPNDFFVWAGAGVEGDNILKLLKNTPDVNQYLTALDRAIDIQAIIKSLKGDLALVIPSLPEDEPEFVITAKTKNQDFLKDVNYWNESMKDYGVRMKENSKNNFTLYADGEELNWGVDGDNVYFASKNSFFKTAFSEKSNKLSQVEDEIKNSIAYAYINLNPLFAALTNEQNLYSGYLKQLSIIDRCCVKVENCRNCTVSIFMDSDENFLTKLLDVIAQSI